MKKTEGNYKYICGVCGWRTINTPHVCYSCGNDAEFEKLNIMGEVDTTPRGADGFSMKERAL